MCMQQTPLTVEISNLSVCCKTNLLGPDSASSYISHTFCIYVIYLGHSIAHVIVSCVKLLTSVPAAWQSEYRSAFSLSRKKPSDVPIGLHGLKSTQEGQTFR